MYFGCILEIPYYDFYLQFKIILWISRKRYNSSFIFSNKKVSRHLYFQVNSGAPADVFTAVKTYTKYIESSYRCQTKLEKGCDRLRVSYYTHAEYFSKNSKWRPLMKFLLKLRRKGPFQTDTTIKKRITWKIGSQFKKVKGTKFQIFENFEF